MASYISQHFRTIETNKMFVFSPAINMKKNGDYQLMLSHLWWHFTVRSFICKQCLDCWNCISAVGELPGAVQAEGGSPHSLVKRGSRALVQADAVARVALHVMGRGGWAAMLRGEFWHDNQGLGRLTQTALLPSWKLVFYQIACFWHLLLPFSEENFSFFFTVLFSNNLAVSLPVTCRQHSF